MSRQLPPSHSSSGSGRASSSSSSYSSGSGRLSQYKRSTGDKPWNNDDEVDLMGSNVNFHRGGSVRSVSVENPNSVEGSAAYGGVSNSASSGEGQVGTIGMRRSNTPPLSNAVAMNHNSAAPSSSTGSGSGAGTSSISTRQTIRSDAVKDYRRSDGVSYGASSALGSSGSLRRSAPPPRTASSPPRSGGSSYARYLERQQQQQQQQQHDDKQQQQLYLNSRQPPSSNPQSTSSRTSRRYMLESRLSNQNASSDGQIGTVRPPLGRNVYSDVDSDADASSVASSVGSSAGRMSNTNTNTNLLGDREIETNEGETKALPTTYTIQSRRSSKSNQSQKDRQQHARELRARRLQMERERGSRASASPSLTTPSIGTTARSRSPAVEKYLSTRNNNNNGNRTNTDNSISNHKLGQHPNHQPTSDHSLTSSAVDSAADRMTGIRNVIKSATERSRTFQRNSDPLGGIDSRIAANQRSAFRSYSSGTGSGTGNQHSTASTKPPTATKFNLQHITAANKSRSNTDCSSSSESSFTDDEAEKSYDDDFFCTGTGTSEDERSWSVRVCVVSAVDLPTNVVPNIPLSPVLRLGLGPNLPSRQQEALDGPQDEQNDNNKTKKKTSSRVRCTACKILSKRDNGSVEFHEELRWDRVRKPQQLALTMELCVRGVLTPTNIKESPPAAQRGRGTDPAEDGKSRQSSKKRQPGSGSNTPNSERTSRLGGLFGRKPRDQREQKSEMITANAAAAVAKLLMEGAPEASSTKKNDSIRPATRPPHQNELDVQLSLPQKKQRKRRKAKMTEDVILGSIKIPLTDIPQLEKVVEDGGGTETARIEKWFELDNVNSSFVSPSSQGGSSYPRTGSSASSSSKVGRRNPSILLEISFYVPTALDDSEDDMDEGSDTLEELVEANPITNSGNTQKVPESVTVPKHLSFQKRQSMEVRNLLKQEKIQKEENIDDPVLEPGPIDFICVVGARDIGNQKEDDGSKGWVNSTPECCVLEQFPSEEFHPMNDSNRMTVLPDKVEWFCFPESCRLWRGTKPPSHEDLNLKRFSASTPPSGITSLAAFDACLNCTTTVSWFVLASNSDEYGSGTVKTYGVVVRFYVAAPAGIDPTQDDFAQMVMNAGSSKSGGSADGAGGGNARKRLWVPVGICVTSALPIVGAMEAILLRICETLSLKRPMYAYNSKSSSAQERGGIMQHVHRELANIILNCQKPIAGVVNCSVPFLEGERFNLSLPSSNGLPALPHGNAVASVCRLLGPDGLNFLLAAVLTECKILMHSDDVANLAMVAEVITALIFPFNWSLPYVPVLPAAMLEFVEAPLSYLLGVPTCNMKHIDPYALEDVVVVNLDSGISATRGITTKVPTPLPATVASNISHAVYRLLRAEEQAVDDFGTSSFASTRSSLPRMEAESVAEREFRITVALEVCGLLRGYQDCLVFASTSQPVFNREKFLKKAPALFEERVNASSTNHGSRPTVRWVLSPRSKRFLSLLVNCQHFHQFLESLGSGDSACFHEIIGMWYKGDDSKKPKALTDIGYSLDLNKALSHILKYLRKVEDVVPTYIVNDNPAIEGDTDSYQNDDYGGLEAFPNNLLLPIVASDESKDSDTAHAADGAVHSISVQYLLELEKNPWRYNKAFDIPCSASEDQQSKDKKMTTIVEIKEKVKLRDAIGDRKYRSWQSAKEQNIDDSETVQSLEDISPTETTSSLDLTSLLTSVTDDTVSETSSVASSSVGSRRVTSLTPEQQRVADAKDRDVLRRCLERAYACKQEEEGSTPSFSDVFMLHGRDLVAQAEVALRNPSAQRFLLSILNKKSRADQERNKAKAYEDSRSGRRRGQSNVSRLEPVAFECVVRLCCAMLDSCMEAKDYEPAYCLLRHTAGLYTILPSDNPTEQNTSMRNLDEIEKDLDSRAMYVTARIGLHPLFADLGLWEKVMELHVLDREQNDKNEASTSARSSGFERGDSSDGLEDASDVVQYEAAVATLYEMLGYGIPAEELARFATRVSDKNGWFSTERARTLLLLARRLSVRRENTLKSVVTGKTGDLEIIPGKSKSATTDGNETDGIGAEYEARSSSILDEQEASKIITEICWCHPAAPSSRRLAPSDQASGRPGTQNLLDMLDEQKLPSSGGLRSSEYMKRSAVTTLATFGTSVVVSGGLDGGVFLAHTIRSGSDLEASSDNDVLVRGLHLDWGSSGSRSVAGSASTSLDGEYGVGAVSCLAAAKGAGYRALAGASGISSKKDTTGPMDDEEILSAMEGSRVVAGTTCGDLRVWSVKDVYAAVALARTGDESTTSSLSAYNGPDGSSSYSTRRKSATSDYGSGSSSNRLKFSLRGRALSGHRGGVTCVDVPSHVYHPDSVVTGGADGLIKLWSLRTPTAGRKSTEGDGSVSIGAPGTGSSLFGSAAASPLVQRLRGSRGGDALSILSGHGGRILCVKTAWHGDRLLSGGADRTIRIWDLVGSGDKCLNSLSGHFGWVTKVQYWGPNTIVSASTDRSIALWDARVRCSPLFVLRHHHSPISDLLVGSRTDPLMVSAGSDGRITSWDFRTLSGAASSSNESSNPGLGPAAADSPGEQKAGGLRQCKVVRIPAATMNLHAHGKFQKGSGPVHLSFGENRSQKTVLSVGSDAVMREWEVTTGRLVREYVTGHCDIISNFAPLTDLTGLMGVLPASDGEATGGNGHLLGGTITSSWDGTIRMRRVVTK